jgi:hypothetical protein
MFRAEGDSVNVAASHPQVTHILATRVQSMHSLPTFPHIVICLYISAKMNLSKSDSFGKVKNISICKNVVGNSRFLYCSEKSLVLPDTADATDNAYNPF